MCARSCGDVRFWVARKHKSPATSRRGDDGALGLTGAAGVAQCAVEPVAAHSQTPTHTKRPSASKVKTHSKPL
jgi:hypothetical protein